MPLTDLVRLLNTRAEAAAPRPFQGGPLVAAAGGVFVHFAGLKLESRFLPIVDTAGRALHGHVAVLRATGLSSGHPLDPEAVFVLPSNDGEFVYLDRLVRTLHALNYLTQNIRGNLLLKVHPRHVMCVPADHGLAFEELLRPCGLIPEQITLEIDIVGIDDLDHLERAVNNYRRRGYGIAIARLGRGPIDFKRLAALGPDIVKLDPPLLASSRPLERLVGHLHRLGARLLVEGVDTAALRHGAAAAGIDFLQAPDLLCRLPAAGEPIPAALGGSGP